MPRALLNDPAPRADAATSAPPAGPAASGPHRLTALAAVLALALLFGGLGALPLVMPDEGRNAEVGREMALSGNWLVPTYNGLPYLDKPAFYFKTVALSFGLLGQGEAAARAPTALSALATLALVWWFGRRAFGVRAAGLAVLALVSAPLYVVYARLVIFDVPLTFFVTAAILCGYLAEEREGAARRRWYLAGAASAGLATLVKGPVGFIVPFLVLAAFHLVERRPRAIARTLGPWNLLVFFAVVLPWFVGLSIDQPGFARYGLLEESFRRFTTGQFRRTEPIWFFPWVLAAGCLGWSLLVPESAIAAWKARRRLSSPERLLVVWAVVVFVFFSISQSKRAGYVLPGVVALALLVARVGDLAIAAPRGRAARLVLRGALGVVALSLVVVALAVTGAVAPDLLAARLHIPPAKVAWFRELFVPIALVIGLTGCAALAARWRRNPTLALASIAALPVLLLVTAFPAARSYATAKTAAVLAQTVEERAPGADVAVWRCWPPGLDFYLRRGLTVFTKGGRESSSNYIPYVLERSRAWPPQLVSYEQTGAWLDARRQPLFVIADLSDREQLARLLEPRGVRIDVLAEEWCGGLFVPRGER